MKQNNNIGIAVVGAGRIGTLRARLAAKHPSVRFLAISDRDPARARRWPSRPAPISTPAATTKSFRHPEVTAVFVSTPEGEHAAPVLQALELGKPVLVEKPLALSLADADDILDDAARDQRQSARRLQPALQGMLSARQGADACTDGSARSSAARRASTTRARRLSPSSSAIRTRRR